MTKKPSAKRKAREWGIEHGRPHGTWTIYDAESLWIWRQRKKENPDREFFKVREVLKPRRKTK